MRALQILAAVPVVAAPLLLFPLVVAPGAAAEKPAAKPTAAPAAAKPGGPKAIGKFDDWTAATTAEGGQTICYAFVRAERSSPAVPGRGDVILTVTQRAVGRDAVAISAGFTYPARAAVTVQADQTALDFYTAGRSAFAREGGKAVATFEKARQVTARSPGPKNAPVVDTFSLKGFGKAYDAISKACPPK
ncbi:conserved exported protein of unknown function [Rhodovastum atsumiense]|uniref:invasion associated locus B family protein n=1 Tax=Rhodovastum atsumiense TaxID=504468 RepID=UPI00193BB7F7|nr:invasion associated locus B family protein [Rhodovastum atsumiense]CAH2600448.1 conserved exported protein of unknown function [Rhodovastum atsumiense]